MVKELLRQCPALNETLDTLNPLTGRNLAHYAAQGGSRDCIELVCERSFKRKALLSERDKQGQTPLEVAEQFKQTSACDYIRSLRSGFVRPIASTSATTRAVAAPSLIESLVIEIAAGRKPLDDLQAHIHQRDPQVSKETIVCGLFCACKLGSVECLQVMLDSLSKRSDDSLLYALRRHHNSDGSGANMLCVAIDYGRVDAARFLLEFVRERAPTELDDFIEDASPNRSTAALFAAQIGL